MGNFDLIQIHFFLNFSLSLNSNNSKFYLIFQFCSSFLNVESDFYFIIHYTVFHHFRFIKACCQFCSIRQLCPICQFCLYFPICQFLQFLQFFQSVNFFNSLNHEKSKGGFGVVNSKLFGV